MLQQTRTKRIQQSNTAAIQHDTAAIQQPPRPHIGEQFLIDTAAIQQADTAAIQHDTAELMYRRGSDGHVGL